MNRGRKLGEISLKILKQLYEGGKYLAEGLIETYEYDKFVRLKIYKQVDNLQRHGYIKKTVENNKTFFQLTRKGKVNVLKHLFLKKSQDEKWDGLWRVIIFDIPEYRKKRRNYLRNELKNLGFIPLQKSVYITPYRVTEDLDQILNEWGLRKYFNYLTVTEIDGEPRLKKIFDLD